MVANESDCQPENNKSDGRSISIYLSEAIKYPGDCGKDPKSRPDWLNMELVNEAKNVFQRHFFAFMFIHMAGLYLHVYLRSIIACLLSTGNSRSVSHLFQRYYSTIIHIKTWYEGDIWDPSDDAHKSLLQVRDMHKRVAKSRYNPKDEQVAFSQYDMVQAQFGFIGLLILYPRQFGCSLSESEMNAVVHYWRGVGYLLGMQDRFNLFESGDLADIRQKCDALLRLTMMEEIRKTPMLEARAMSAGIVQSVSSYIPLVDSSIVAKYLFEVIGLEKQVHVNLIQKITFYCMKFCFMYMYHLRIFASVLNLLLRRALIIAGRNRDRISKDLQETYGNQLVSEKILKFTS